MGDPHSEYLLILCLMGLYLHSVAPLAWRLVRSSVGLGSVAAASDAGGAPNAAEGAL